MQKKIDGNFQKLGKAMGPPSSTYVPIITLLLIMCILLIYLFVES